MLNENDFAPGWGSFNHQQWLTGPSTNGRSSAFGALCLGSNPSGPAKKSPRSRVIAVIAVIGKANARLAGSKKLRAKGRELAARSNNAIRCSKPAHTE